MSLQNERNNITCLGDYRNQSSREELIHKFWRKNKVIIVPVLRCYFKGYFRKHNENPGTHEKEKIATHFSLQERFFLNSLLISPAVWVRVW